LSPLPVDVVTPVPPLPTGKVPDTPVAKGKPVQLVRLPEAGVPRAGVTRVGDVERTLSPLPVDVVTPVPPLPTGKVPETPVAKGKPVQLVRILPAAGVPRTGVTRVGVFERTLLPLPVDVVTPVPPRRTGKVPAVTCVAEIETASAPATPCVEACGAAILASETISVYESEGINFKRRW